MQPMSQQDAATPVPVARPTETGRPRRSRERMITGYFFVAPSLVLFTIFSFVPIVISVVFSFQDVPLFGGGHWIGGENYQNMVNKSLFWTSLKNTLVFTVASVPLSIALGLLVAVMLNRRLPGRALLRSFYFLPMVVSGVAISLIMRWILNADYGVANRILQAIGLPAVSWLASPGWAMVTLILAVAWGRIGFCMVIYLGALQSIPAGLLEAAQIDGANAWQRFASVVWPLLRPVTFLLIVLNVVFSMQAFDVIYVLTGGGPGFSTTVFVQYIFRSAFTDGQMGYASALGVVLTLILLTFSMLRYRASRHYGDDLA